MDAARRLLPLLAATASAACVVFLLGLHLDSFRMRLPCKPWPHLALIAWVLSEASGAYARRIAAAIAVCMVADFLLEFRQTLFLHGMATFFVAQLTLASAFVLRSREWRPAMALPFAAWVGLLFVVVSPGLGSMRVPVAFYTGAIGLMLWRAAVCVAARVASPQDDASRAPGRDDASTAASRGGVGDSVPRSDASAWIALAGAVVFGASDSVIALDRFHAPIPGARFLIMITYWTALALLAASAVRTRGEVARRTSS